LDRNTTGTLLITNDGELANRLMHPKYEIQKSYTVLLDEELRPDDAKRIAEGVELEDGFTSPCEVFIYPDNKRKTLVTLHEGRNREVRRIFESFGYTVKSLDRKFYAGLSVRGLKRGEYRHLTRQEVADLKKMVGIKRW
jgi:23S rRNA pseudouridine2605 synthase